MPKIPQLNISTESRVQPSSLSIQRPQDISVRRATPMRAVSSGKGAMAPALHSLSEALHGLSQVFAQKEELARVSKSQEMQMGVNEVFRNMWAEDAKKVGGQTAGMLQTFADQEEDLRNAVIPDDLDARTTRELTEHFNHQFTRHATKLTEHTIRQSKVADEAARMLSVQDAKKNIFALPIGDTRGIDQEINNVLKAELARHPELTENQIEISSKTLREDFVSYALTKWASDSPVTTATFWNQNQTYLKNALPNIYTKVAAKMKVVSEDASYDLAFESSLSLAGGNAALASDLIFRDTDGVFKLNSKQRMHLSSSLSARHRSEMTRKADKVQKEEEDYLRDAHQQFYDPEAKRYDNGAALINLEKAYRSKVVDSSSYNAQFARLTSGAKFGAEQSKQLLTDINNRGVTKIGQILERTQGTDEPVGQYVAALKARDAEITKGFTKNYFNEAYKVYTNLAKITKRKDLPEKEAAIGEKALLVDPNELSRFKEDLENRARKEGYSAGDPRITDIAEKMMEAVWYKTDYTGAISREGLTVGEAPWHVFGETVSRRWEAEALLPETKKTGESGETATGGSPPEKRKWTPDEQQAYEDLTGAGVPVTDANIQERLRRIVFEREAGAKG